MVVGRIDDRGAIHHRAIKVGQTDKSHGFFWPGKSNKLWRFNLTEWQLEESPLSGVGLTKVERLDIIACMRKYYKPPLWLVEGEEWEALGRPRSGPAYKKHCKRWDRKYKRKVDS